MSEAVCVKDLSFSYQSGGTLLSHVDLDIMEGEKWALIGPNGSGKSTLVKLIVGLLRPVAGSVKVFGKTASEAAGSIGYVPQKMNLEELSAISVDDFIMSGLTTNKSLFSFKIKHDSTRISEILESFDLARFRNSAVGDLSGGFLQRAQIARVLLMDPKLLVLDEALSSLDPRKENEIFELIQRLRPDLTVLLVTHDMGVVSHHISKVACLTDQLVVHKTEALNDQVMREVFGGQVRAISHKHTEDVEHKH